jgi:hypothetical protein
MKGHVGMCCGDEGGEWRPLSRGQRCARLVAGLGLLMVAVALPWSGVGGIVLSLVFGWVGASHVVAAATAYRGCPELGAVSSLLLRRTVKIGCGPWRWLDARLRLSRERAEAVTFLCLSNRSGRHAKH